MTMFPYTRENHFQFGYKNSSTLATRWLDLRATQHEMFVARYGRAKGHETSWRTANSAAAREILMLAFEQQLTPVVCCSGGLDSEITLLSFFEAWIQLPVEKRPALETATLDFDQDLNRHDTDYVEKFIDRFKPKDLELTSRRYTLDVKTFCAGEEFLALATEAQVISPAVVCQLWLCEKIQRENPRALPIIGQGEMHLVRDEDLAGSYRPRPWSLVETENLCALYRFFIGRGLPAVPGFFQYTPEQFEAQLRLNPVIHELISNSREGKLGTRSSKAEILSFDYPELEPRPKFTGFEKIEALYDERREFLASQPGASDAKWLRSVFDLTGDLRPLARAPQTFEDWSFAWGRGGETKSARTSPDDVFATEWSDPGLLRSAFQTSPAVTTAEFTAALISYLYAHLEPVTPASPTTAMLQDGSQVSRLFNCILNRHFLGRVTAPRAGVVECIRPRDVKVPSSADLARLVLEVDSVNSETLARLLHFRSTRKETRVLIPLLHGRIVNAEFDRELESTLIRPRFVWTENESLAVLSAALGKTSDLASGALTPWTSAALASAMIGATRSTGWFESDEPGASNRLALEKFYDMCLGALEETPAERELADACASEFALLKKQIESTLARSAFPQTRLQVSAYDLESYSLKPFNLASCFLNLPNGLKIISETRWLEQAKARVPDLRLGANLFFQQGVSGFALLDKNLRVYFALQNESACAQVLVLRNAPHGRLRIRGVTTRIGFERQGHATELLTKIVTALRSAAPHLKGFQSVDVYAAPEVVKAFRSAGFEDDVSRVTRIEEVIDPLTGELTASERELTPLTFLLGET